MADEEHISETLGASDAPGPSASSADGETEVATSTPRPRKDALDASLPAIVPDGAADGPESLAASGPSEVPESRSAHLSVPLVAGPKKGDGTPKHASKTPHRMRRAVLAVVAVLLSMLAIAYAGGALVFAHLLFLPGTSINGQDVSLVSVSDVAARHQERLADYALAVEGEGLDFSIPASEIDLTIDGDAYVRQAQAQINVWLWPYLAFQRRDLTVEAPATFDGNAVARIVEEEVTRANEGATPPVAASVELSAETGRYEVVDGVPGTEIDAAAVEVAVTEALVALEPSLTITSEQLSLPSITADDERLASEAATLNAYVDAVQTLTVAGTGVFAVGGAQIAQWLVVGEDHSVSVDGNAVTAWTRGDLSRVLDSVGATRSYTRPDGKAIQVSGGTYGWSIDGAALAATMVANIQAGTAATVEIPMLQAAAAWNPGGADWGARYVDIDLSEQHVRLYDDTGSLIWESACVSGDVSKAHATPTGVYSINGNMTSGNVELRGLIDPKTNEPEYISYVTYWMPFIDNAIALHDASWRASFGGGIYQYNGSHGCVNLPTDAAASLFGIVHVGDVVVVHG